MVEWWNWKKKLKKKIEDQIWHKKTNDIPHCFLVSVWHENHGNEREKREVKKKKRLGHLRQTKLLKCKCTCTILDERWHQDEILRKIADKHL